MRLRRSRASGHRSSSRARTGSRASGRRRYNLRVPARRSSTRPSRGAGPAGRRLTACWVMGKFSRSGPAASCLAANKSQHPAPGRISEGPQHQISGFGRHLFMALPTPGIADAALDVRHEAGWGRPSNSPPHPMRPTPRPTPPPTPPGRSSWSSRIAGRMGCAGEFDGRPPSLVSYVESGIGNPGVGNAMKMTPKPLIWCCGPSLIRPGAGCCDLFAARNHRRPAENFPITQQAVASDLQVLHRAGLVEERRAHGRLYLLRPDALDPVGPARRSVARRPRPPQAHRRTGQEDHAS